MIHELYAKLDSDTSRSNKRLVRGGKFWINLEVHYNKKDLSQKINIDVKKYPHLGKVLVIINEKKVLEFRYEPSQKVLRHGCAA